MAQQFFQISNSVHELPRKYSDIIVELADQIGKGMATFVGLEIVTMEDLESVRLFSKFLLFLSLKLLTFIFNTSVFLRKVSLCVIAINLCYCDRFWIRKHW